jgi:hypothetical protein
VKEEFPWVLLDGSDISYILVTWNFFNDATPQLPRNGHNYKELYSIIDRLCGLVVRVLGYRSGGPGSIPGTTRKKKKSSGSGTGST